MPVPQIYKVSESPFGSSYEEHVKKFWQTFLEIPLSDNPMNVPDKCEAQNPSEPVFYLPAYLGRTIERKCTTSAGKSILIPVICVVVLPNEANPKTLMQQRKVAHNDQDSVIDMELKITAGRSNIILNRAKLLKFRIRTGTFTAQLPPGGLYGADPGHNYCVADGYYVITKPIVAGTYTFDFGGKLECKGDCVPNENNFETKSIITLEAQ
jgi:hypothetical protein